MTDDDVITLSQVLIYHIIITFPLKFKIYSNNVGVCQWHDGY